MEEYENRKGDALRSGDNFDEEMREFPIGEVGAFQSTEEKFVVCLDTLGQDRGFSDTERRFVLTTIQTYRKIWEAEQRGNLTRDRDERLMLAKGPVEDEGAEAPEDKPDAMVELERSIEEVLNT